MGRQTRSDNTRVEDDEVERSVTAENTSLTRTSARAASVSLGVVDGSRDGRGVHIDSHDGRAPVSREERVDATPGSHVEHEINRVSLGDHSFNEEARDWRDRLNVRWHDQAQTEIVEGQVRALPCPALSNGALTPIRDALNVAAGQGRHLERQPLVPRAPSIGSSSRCGGDRPSLLPW